VRELHCESVPVRDLAKRFGTPLYAYSATAIRERYRTFDAAFAALPHTICYSVKANSNLSILRLLVRLGSGFDIVSGGELQRIKVAASKAAGKVVFSGVGKTADEMDEALRAGILMFNVESASELDLLGARAEHLRRRADFAIRVNPDVAAKTHPYIATGLHQHKFGVPWGDAAELYRSARSKYLRASGVSVHIGSQISDVDAFGEAMQRVGSLVRSLRAEGHDILYVDAGGGLAIAYSQSNHDNFAAEVRRYSRAVMKPLRGLGVHLLLEPGRAIVGPAGALITRVLYRKQNEAKKFLIVDAAMNDLMRPALYDAYHEIVPVSVTTNPEQVTADIVGPVCESGDFFARDRTIPNVAAGNLLAVLDAGAYGMALASHYNTRPRAAEVLVEGKRVRVIRKRETVADLLAPERV
jgi:diaminopimelate decarboxylase